MLLRSSGAGASRSLRGLRPGLRPNLIRPAFLGEALAGGSSTSLSSFSSVTRGDSVIELHGVTSRLPDGRTLFENINLNLLSKTIVGIVGPNGAGKSTFLKLLAGGDDLATKAGLVEGRVAVRPGTTVTYLAQEPELDETLDVRGNVALGGGAAFMLLRRFEEVNTLLSAEGASPEETQALVEEQAELMVQLDECDAWSLDSRVDKVMSALTLPPGASPVAHLSGGEKRRVALCRALMEEPDVLLLDEPTNHLDALSVAWLEDYLRAFDGAVVAVTHDRALLEALAQWVVDVEHGGLSIYQGNYSSYLEQKGKQMDGARSKEAATRRALANELAFVQNRNKASVGSARLKRLERLQAAAQEHSAKAAEQMAQGAIVIPPPARRLGAVVLTAKNLSRTVTSTNEAEAQVRCLFRGVSFDLEPGAVVGVVGRNGCGKTTLFNMLAGLEESDQAEAQAGGGRGGGGGGGGVDVGESVSLGLVAQSRQNLDPNQTVLECIAEGEDAVYVGGNASGIPMRHYVASFALKGASQEKKVGVLSGGERNRVHLARVLKRRHNLLLLDEPTNDLDVQTLRSLEDALNTFDGTAVVISHDRWFLDRICTHTLVFEDNPAAAAGAGRGGGGGALVAPVPAATVEFFPGSFSEYRAEKARLDRGKGGARADGAAGAASEAKPKKEGKKKGKKKNKKQQ